jgi:hypothetical protein
LEVTISAPAVLHQVKVRDVEKWLAGRPEEPPREFAEGEVEETAGSQGGRSGSRSDADTLSERQWCRRRGSNPHAQ